MIASGEGLSGSELLGTRTPGCLHLGGRVGRPRHPSARQVLGAGQPSVAGMLTGGTARPAH